MNVNDLYFVNYNYSMEYYFNLKIIKRGGRV